MELKELMLKFLAATLGKSNEEVEAILFKKADDGALTDEISETAFETLEELHAKHLSDAPQDRIKAAYDEGHGKGKFEALSKAEEDLRKVYGIESKGNLKTLIAEAVAKATKDGATDDKILTSQLYLSKVSEYEEKFEALRTESEAKIAEATGRAERQMRFNTIMPKIDAALAGAGVDLATVRPATKAAFAAQFEGRDFDIQETGIYIKNADGSLIKDKHGHPVKLESFIASEAPNWFDIAKQPPRQNPGNDHNDPQKPGKWNKDNVPKTAKEFEAIYSTLAGDEAKEFVAAFDAANRPQAQT